MEPIAFWFVVAALAAWRVTHLLAFEDGPGRWLARLRAAAGDGALGTLFDCFFCLSLWVALPFAAALGSGVIDRIMLWLGLSGAACLLERVAGRGAAAAAPAAYYEGQNQEEHDALLRRSSPGDARTGR